MSGLVILRRTLVSVAMASGVLVVVAVVYLISGGILSGTGYLDTACDSDEVTTSTGVTYSLASPAHGSMGCELRRRVAGAWRWEVVPEVHAGASYNDIHDGIVLKLSDDERLLFVVRNTRRQDETPIWTDVFDISAEPVSTVVQGPDCCIEERSDDPTTTDSEGLRRRGQEVFEMALESGAAP